MLLEKSQGSYLTYAQGGSGRSAYPVQRRNALAPGSPTLTESGLADFVALTFTGVVAPAGTPARDRRKA